MAALLLALALLSLLAGLTLAGPADDGDPGGDFDERQVVIKLNPASRATITDINAAYNTTLLKTLLASSGIYLLETPQGEDEEDLAELMEKDPRLLYAEPNYIGEAPEADPCNIYAWGGGVDPVEFTSQYAPGLLNLAWAQEIDRGAGVVVAVLDTGADLAHPQLVNSWTADRYDFVDDDPLPEDLGNGLDDDGNGRIDEAAGHGTHVAGIIHLVAPEAQIMPLRVLDSDGRGNIFLIAEALLYAAGHGVSVINLSLGTSNVSDLLMDIIDDLLEQEIVVVAAAGNLAGDIPQYPAAVSDVIAVSAIGPSQTLASFANFGSWVDVAAPGQAIYSTFPPGGYAYWSGTSMATPFVAGQAALIRGVAPDLSASEIETLIRGTARSLDASNPAFAGLLGAGLPDVGASLGCHWADLWPDQQHDIFDHTCDNEITIMDIIVQAEAWGLNGHEAASFDHDEDGLVTVADLMQVSALGAFSALSAL